MKRDGTGMFESFIGACRIFIAMCTPFLRGVRAWHGCTKEERSIVLPGDDLTPNPEWRYVHAITIDAPVGRVWPWIVQIGQGRGGFYSYQGLENIAGCQIVNADRIIPELQNLREGDGIRLHPAMPPLTVAVLEQNRALVLHACGNMLTGEQCDPTAPGPRPDGVVNTTWTFFLIEDGKGGTRLYSSNRVEHGRALAVRLSNGPLLIEPMSYAMDTKMLDGIKRRVETCQD